MNNVRSSVPVEAAGAPVALLDLGQRALLRGELGSAIVAELEASFWTDYAALIVRARSAADRGDRSDLDEAIHTIKGAAANLGFAAIADAAEGLRAPVGTGGQAGLAALGAIAAATRQLLNASEAG